MYSITTRLSVCSYADWPPHRLRRGKAPSIGTVCAAVAWLVLWLAAPVAAQGAGFHETLRRGQQELYNGRFEVARTVFLRQSATHPARPEPSALLAATAFWRWMYAGNEPSLLDTMRTHARAAYRKADRLPESAQRSFWRGGSQLMELLSSSLSQGGGRLGVTDLMRMPMQASQVRAATADLERALAVDPGLTDARFLLVLLRECRGRPSQRCIDGVWRSLNGTGWLRPEAQYLMLNLLFAAGLSPEELQGRAIPLALELHHRYPSNALFHLALAKISYEAGHIEEAKAHSREIVARGATYGRTFALEARYYLGVVALEESECGTGIQHLMEIVRARPRHPDYLMPWSLLRLAQCNAALGRQDAATTFARQVLAYPNIENVHREARALLTPRR